MILEQAEYNKLVIAAFNKQKAEKKLSLLLANSTRGKIRRACVNRYQERNSERDDLLLRDFFGPGEPGRQVLQLIENSGVEEFRTLNNYLNKETGFTDDLNMELLAWLIDFKHRPYSEDNNFELSDEELAIIDSEDDSLKTFSNKTGLVVTKEPLDNSGCKSETESQSDGLISSRNINLTPEDEKNLEMEEKSRDSKDGELNENEESHPAGAGAVDTELKPPQKQEPNDPVNPIAVIVYGEPLNAKGSSARQTTEIKPAPEKPVNTKDAVWYKKPAYIFPAVLSVCVVVAFIIVQPNPECMVWTGDHYEKIACSEQPKGRAIVPFEKNQYLVQKISREDTIKEQHVGKLYYIKNNNDYQYFTHAGKYPEDMKRDLQKLSLHIYETDSLNRRSPQITQR